MTVTDDQISAWLHGSASEEEAMEMEALAANVAEVASRVAKLRRMDDLLRQAVPLEESLPPELMARLGLAPAPVSNVVDLAAARAARVVLAPAAPSRFAVFSNRGWRIAAQLFVVLGIGLAAAQWAHSPAPQSAEATYQALGDAPVSGLSANGLLMFSSDTDAGEAHAIAARAGVQIIGAPTSAGAWKIAVDPARRDAVLKQLRGLPGVTMAEPIDGAGQ